MQRTERSPALMSMKCAMSSRRRVSVSRSGITDQGLKRRIISAMELKTSRILLTISPVPRYRVYQFYRINSPHRPQRVEVVCRWRGHRQAQRGGRASRGGGDPEPQQATALERFSGDIQNKAHRGALRAVSRPQRCTGLRVPDTFGIFNITYLLFPPLHRSPEVCVSRSMGHRVVENFGTQFAKSAVCQGVPSAVHGPQRCEGTKLVQVFLRSLISPTAA